MNDKLESKVAIDNLFKSSGYRHKIIFGSIISTLVIFGGLGWLIDYLINSQPWGFMVGVIISFIVSQYFIYKKLIRYTKKILDNK